MATATLSIKGSDSRIELRDGGTHTFGRLDMPAGEPASKSVSREQVIFEFNSGVLRATRLGAGHSCLGSEPGRDLAKNESIELHDGETYYLHCTLERPICGVTVSLSAPNPQAVARLQAAAPPPVPLAPEPDLGTRDRGDGSAAQPAKRARLGTGLPGSSEAHAAPSVAPFASAALAASAMPSASSASAASAASAAPSAPSASAASANSAIPSASYASAASATPFAPPAPPAPSAPSAPSAPPAPPAPSASASQLRALTLTWRPTASSAPCPVSVVITLDEAFGQLSARACDGHETRVTEAPVGCPWRPLPPAEELRAVLKLHPVYTTDRWRLVLHSDGDTRSASLDLCKPSSLVGAAGAAAAAGAAGAASSMTASAGVALGGAGGGMLHTLLGTVGTLRAAAAEHAAAIVTLRASAERREAALQNRIEQLRAAEAEELACLLPLLLAKQDRLATLELEAQNLGIDAHGGPEPGKDAEGEAAEGEAAEDAYE